MGGPSAARSRKTKNPVERGKTAGRGYKFVEKEYTGNAIGQYYTAYCVLLFSPTPNGKWTY
jgi:hypothetical protein